MRDGREGAARSCARFCAHVVGARVAGVVCACVCAGMRPEAARRAPTWPRAAEQAAAWRDLMRVHITNILLTFSGRQDSHSRDGHRVQHGNT
jgi:predicted kinase